MQEAATAGEQRMRMLRLAVGRVAVESGGRRRGPERAFVAHRRTQPSGLGSASAGIETPEPGRRLVKTGGWEWW